MRAIISHALAWLKKVKPKAAQPEVDGLVEERPANYEEYLRRKAERNANPKKEAEKAAEALSKSMEELAAGVKGLADSGTHEMLYIAGIPGYQTQKAWFPQLTPFDRITQKQLEKVHKALVRRKLDPAPAMSQLYGHFVAHCGHLGLDSKGPSDKVKPPRKS
jgi:ATPase subunit of ABC transporter with duplicated ATPase domains